jgi:hypothetical protein
MLTCKSPRKVMRVAYAFAIQVLPAHSSKFGRHDFTLAQLFACLVLREHQQKSYRGVEALLRDARHWCRQIGMRRVPDHNTLCRAMRVIMTRHRVGRLLDLMARWANEVGRWLGSTLAIDSTHLDVRHCSRHYEQRCRHYAESRSRSVKAANALRSRSNKRAPKLTLGVETRCHLILSARPSVGTGCDSPGFAPALREAARRQPQLLRVLADSGFDSHANHVLAREAYRLRSLIKAGTGRPSQKLPASKYRRRMKQELAGSQAGRLYGRRAQVECVNSMLKRNLGDSLRGRSVASRNRELLLRAVTHNLMLIRCQSGGSRQSRFEPLLITLEKHC